MSSKRIDHPVRNDSKFMVNVTENRAACNVRPRRKARFHLPILYHVPRLIVADDM